MFDSLISCITCCENGDSRSNKIVGKVVLVKKYVLDLNDVVASAEDRVDEALSHRVSLQLISKVNTAGDVDDNGTEGGKIGKPAYFEDWITSKAAFVVGESHFKVLFDWEESVGIPGAFLIKNHHHNEFYLKSVTLENVPSLGCIHFLCNSWVYPVEKYDHNRVFFSNQTYLPSDTPLPLLKYRAQELANLRGNGTEKFEEHDRVYDYALYNDLGNSDKGDEHARQTLGGSSDFPYPRRGKTGRKPSKSDPSTESRLPLKMKLKFYAPRDEQLAHLKMSDFQASDRKAKLQIILPKLKSDFDKTPKDFDTFQDVLDLYEGGIRLPGIAELRDRIPFEYLKEILPTEGEGLLKYPMPDIIKADKSAWMTDVEFGREMLAGINPVTIRCLQEFPPVSKLDPDVHGDQTSTITEEQIERNLDGLTVSEALDKNRLFILDHHDMLMPYIRRINENTSSKVYATRTVLFLEKCGTLKPLAIELSLPHPQRDEYGAISKTYTPAENGVEGTLWQLAKTYVAVNDSGVHQLISHWLRTHAVVEPFVIATNRQLSVLHPVHKLLHPHLRDTMFINGIARQTLICEDGYLEVTVFPGKYAMQMSSAVYKNWSFPDQALPKDLLMRGMAVEDCEAPQGLRLLIEDYPYAVDGLEIWSAIETWVQDYCSLYYKSDEMVQNDSELQAWWHELRTEGHGDLKNMPCWPKMQTVSELTLSCTILIWLASALHAAVNFGQYAYAGYIPSRPSISRKLMPEPNTPEYDELETNPERAYMKTINSPLQSLLNMSVIELLSRHASDEVYLGQRADAEWTADEAALASFSKFGKRLKEIEQGITARNNDENLKNRSGPVQVPYTLLYPTSGTGLTGKGIPNSVSV